MANSLVAATYFELHSYCVLSISQLVKNTKIYILLSSSLAVVFILFTETFSGMQNRITPHQLLIVCILPTHAVHVRTYYIHHATWFPPRWSVCYV